VFELAPLVVIGTECTGSWKSNQHTITTIYKTLHRKLKNMNLIVVVNSDEGGEQFFSTNITRRVTVGTNLVMNEEWTSLLLRQIEHIFN
jgi:hypothetical protein